MQKKPDESATEAPSVSAVEFDNTGQLFFKRALVSEDICSSTEGYFPFIQRNKGGICFGAALYWISDSFKKIRENASPLYVSNDGQGPDMLKKMDVKFYDFSHGLQMAYEHLYIKTLSMELIVNNLNAQEEFLFASLKEKQPRLHYSSVNRVNAVEIAQRILLKNESYQNTAIILSTSLEYSIRRGPWRHSTVLMNYKGRLFFFDANKGIYFISGKQTLHWTSLLSTLTTTLGLNELKDNHYGIDDNCNIFAKIVG
ncbi:hypothetical protein [Enterobacter sp. Bisph1]|uniref:hypothetical protein n=1 Tax=Enterobacter sp. Bisph1 TaxID=1274399 RepID=UPI00057C2A82|nr:hypothetical protein [Enterobacter sp. Bisph1]